MAAAAWVLLAAACTSLPEAVPSPEDQRLDPLKIGPELIDQRETPGSLERAITLFRWHLRQQPDSVDLNALIAEAHARSIATLDLKNPDDRPLHRAHRTEGLRHAQEALRIDPGHAPAHYWLAILLLHAAGADIESSPNKTKEALAHLSEALTHLSKADQLSPKVDEGGPARVRGKVLQELPVPLGGSLPKAIACYLRSLELAPDFITTHLWLAQAYLGVQKPDLAKKELSWVAAAQLRKGHEKEDGEEQRKALELIKKLDAK
jgi:tetratricopeptide (TPR) repeat protein